LTIDLNWTKITLSITQKLKKGNQLKYNLGMSVFNCQDVSTDFFLSVINLCTAYKRLLYNESNKATRLQKQKCRSEIAHSLSAMENLATQLHADLDMSTQVQKALEAAETLDKTAGMNRKDFLWTCNF
jgi:hypothetical protein